MLKVAEVAKKLNCSIANVHALVESGRLPVSQAPHTIEQQDGGDTPRYRLVGPGVTSKWYTEKDQIQRLEDLRDLMNYVA